MLYRLPTACQVHPMVMPVQLGNIETWVALVSYVTMQLTFIPRLNIVRTMVESLTDAAIQQLNLGYDAEQDRLLLKVGLADDAEIPVWLTRRVVKVLWQLLQGLEASSAQPVQEVYTGVSQDVLEKFAREAEEHQQAQKISDNLKFGEAYEERHHALSDQPLLIHHCQMLNEQDGRAILEMASKDGNTVRFNLNLELRIALTSMLQLATKEADWGLKLTSSQSLGNQQPTPTVLH